MDIAIIADDVTQPGARSTRENLDTVVDAIRDGAIHARTGIAEPLAVPIGKAMRVVADAGRKAEAVLELEPTLGEDPDLAGREVAVTAVGIGSVAVVVGSVVVFVEIDPAVILPAPIVKVFCTFPPNWSSLNIASPLLPRAPVA